MNALIGAAALEALRLAIKLAGKQSVPVSPEAIKAEEDLSRALIQELRQEPEATAKMAPPPIRHTTRHDLPGTEELPVEESGTESSQGQDAPPSQDDAG